MPGKKIDKADAAKILSDVNPENAFQFYIDEGQFTGQSANNLSQLCELIKSVDVKSVEFHLHRGDFEKWVRFIGDNILSMQLAKNRNTLLEGEQLREKIVEIISRRIEKLKSLELSP